MKLSTRTRYGMRALVDLSIHSRGKPVQLKAIARRQDISVSYLEHLIIPLISAGIVKTIRGSKGGVMLAKNPENINLKNILEILEGPLAPVDCLKEGSDCVRSGSCATQELWDKMKTAIENVLVTSNLKDLAEKQKIKELCKTDMYYI